MRTLLHVSDTHILPNAGDLLQGVDTLQNVHDVFQRVADSGVGIDAVIFSGDLADGGQLASYQRLRPELDALGTKVIVAIGNHDARAAFCAGLLDGEASDDPIEYVSWIEGLRVIVLDSTVPGKPYGTVRPEQLAWLRAELATPAPEGSILVMHHPPVPDPTPLAGLLTLHGAADLEDAVRGSGRGRGAGRSRAPRHHCGGWRRGVLRRTGRPTPSTRCCSASWSCAECTVRGSD